MSGNPYNRGYKKFDSVRSSSSKQASAAYGSSYGSQAPRGGSLHGTSNSWGGKSSEDYPARDQDRFAGAPADESLYVASNAGRGPEKMAGFRDPDYISELGIGDLTRFVEGNSAPPGSMAGLAAGIPSVMAGRRGVGMSPTNAFDPRVSHGSFIAGTRASGFAGPSLPIGKGDSIDPSRENHGKASSGTEPVAPTFKAHVAEEFAAVVSKIPVKGELSEALLKSVVSSSISGDSVGSLQARSSISGDSVGSEMARAHELAMSALKLEQERLNFEFEELNRQDKRHILVTDPAMIGLRGSVSTAPPDSRVYTSDEVQILQTKLDLLQNLLDKKTKDHLDLEEGTRGYMIKTQTEIEILKEENVSLVQYKSEWIENLFLIQDNACKIQEKLCDKIQQQNHTIQALTQCMNERSVRIKELEQSVERLVAEKRLDVSMQGEGYVCVDNPGEKMCIQAYANQDVVMAMKCLNKEILEKKLDELYSKQVFEEEIAEITEKLVQDVRMEIYMQVVQELPEIPDTKNVSEAVEEAGASPVAREEPAGLLSTDEKLTFETETLSLRAKPYSRHAFTRILKDHAFVECLLPYPFFGAVFDNRSLRDNLHLFAEDIIREGCVVFGRELNPTNDQVLGCLQEILLERKKFSPDHLKAFVDGTTDFCFACFPNGTPSANLGAFDLTEMSFQSNQVVFFNYFVKIYVSWNTEASNLFARLVAEMGKDY